MLGLLDKRDARDTRLTAAMGGALESGTSMALAGKRLSTSRGWQSVDAMMIGREMSTFDEGAERAVANMRSSAASPVSFRAFFHGMAAAVLHPMAAFVANGIVAPLRTSFTMARTAVRISGLIDARLGEGGKPRPAA